jgi:Sulfotransferase family
MSQHDGDRVREWKPPARPDWVQRLNDEGRHLDLKSVVPLDEDSLIGRAKANTGLHDLGEDDWYEPFQVLIKSFDEESALHLMGRVMARSDLISYLEARLRIEHAYQTHPEIDDEQIVKPIVIVGQGRSGTSGLLNLLARDPDNGVCKTWEAYFPCPPPERQSYLSDPRIARADALITQWNRVVPELASVHEFNGEIPTETIQLHCLSFQSPSWFSMTSPAPSYVQFMAKRGVLPALRYEKRVLKLLQWKNPRKHWVLKSPDATRYMPEVASVYPDVCLVWSHRDPVKALSSTINTLGTLAWTRSDRPLAPGVFEHVTNAENCAAMLCQPIELIENDPGLRARLCNVQYLDFIRTPLAVVEKIYATSGRSLSAAGREAMQKYMDNYPRTTRPSHRYDIGSTATVARERMAFKRYEEYFEITSET